MKTLLLLGLIAIVLVLWYTREGFTSKKQVDAIVLKAQKLNLPSDPDVKSIDTQPALAGIKQGPNRGIAVFLRYGLPVGLIAAFGDIQGESEFTVKSSVVDTILTGGFDTSQLTADKYIATAELIKGAAIPDQDKVNIHKLEPNIAGMAKAAYYSLTKGGCPPGSIPEVDKLCNTWQNDPELKSAITPWTQSEKDLIRRLVSKIVTIVPDTPLASSAPPARFNPKPAPSMSGSGPLARFNPNTPAPSMAGSAYSATCTKCLLVNNQLSCSCDVAAR